MLDGYKGMDWSVYVQMRNQERKKGDEVKKLEAADDRLLDEIEKEKRKPLVAYGKRGVNRANMIEELQEINRFGDKKHLEAALMKEKEMRKNIEMGLNNPGPIDNKARLRNKYDMQMPTSSK